MASQSPNPNEGQEERREERREPERGQAQELGQGQESRQAEQRASGEGAGAAADAHSGAGAGEQSGRTAREWLRDQMNPAAFLGAALLLVISALATAFFTGVFQDDDGGGGKEETAASSGGTGTGAGPSTGTGPGTGTSGECRGASCQGKGANDYGCAGDARVLAHAEKGVYLELKYSPECAAAWGKITQGRVGDVVTIDRGVGKKAQAVITSGYDNHTTMVPAEGDFTLAACAEPNATDGTADWDRFCVEATNEDAPAG